MNPHIAEFFKLSPGEYKFLCDFIATVKALLITAAVAALIFGPKFFRDLKLGKHPFKKTVR